MGMTKYTGTEEAEVLSPDEHKEIEDELHRLGKTSATELNDEERKTLMLGIEPYDKHGDVTGP